MAWLCLQKTNKKSSASSRDGDREAAADILDNEGQEFRDDEGHPHPLYVPGKTLVLLFLRISTL